MVRGGVEVGLAKDDHPHVRVEVDLAGPGACQPAQATLWTLWGAGVAAIGLQCSFVFSLSQALCSSVGNNAHFVKVNACYGFNTFITCPITVTVTRCGGVCVFYLRCMR